MKRNIILLLTFLSLNVYSQDTLQTNATVFAVHDGDSYKIKFDTSSSKVWIRLYGADCPEVKSPYVKNTQTYGKETGDYVRNLIKGKRVYITPISTDVYDRMLAKVIYDGKDMTEFLIENGYAWFYDPSDKNMNSDEKIHLKELQKAAKQKKLGLWGQPGVKLSPSTFRKRN